MIECKNLFGDIEITNKGEFIRTVEYGGRKYKEGIYSPITQNQRHLQVMKECRTGSQAGLIRWLKNYSFETFFRGLIVFANPKTIVNDKWAKKEVKNQVIRADQLIETIKRMNKESKEFSSSPKDLLQAGHRYLEMNREYHTDYLEKFRNMIQNQDDNQGDLKNPEGSLSEAESDIRPEKLSMQSEDTHQGSGQEQKKMCPRCGKELVLREAKRGAHVGEKFYGCSGYPKCRYIEKCEA